MKSYEVIIEADQPTCGGKSPKAVQLREVQTDDPAAYVRAQEQGIEPTVSETPEGDIVAEVHSGDRNVVYRFSEI